MYCSTYHIAHFTSYKQEASGVFLFVLTWVDFFFPFIFINWRLIALQYCNGFCHTLTSISHGFTWVDF